MRTDEVIEKDVVEALTPDSRGRELSAMDEAMSIFGVTEGVNQMADRHPAGTRVPTDDEIIDNVLLKLAATADLDVLDLAVSVKAGTVTLRGTVNAYWKKDFAERLIASEPGITTIDNHLAVAPTTNRVDQAIARDIVSSLEALDEVDAERVEVSVVDGTATLTGPVPDWSALQSALEAALHAICIKSVKNNLVITGK